MYNGNIPRRENWFWAVKEQIITKPRKCLLQSVNPPKLSLAL